jgi:ATP-dependent protease Clp ATPase subunit
VKKFNPDEPLRCSFCHKTQEQAKVLIKSPVGGPTALICDDCVKACGEILEDREKSGAGKNDRKKTPGSIFLDWVSGRILAHHQAEVIPAENILTRRLGE